MGAQIGGNATNCTFNFQNAVPPDLHNGKKSPSTLIMSGQSGS